MATRLSAIYAAGLNWRRRLPDNCYLSHDIMHERLEAIQKLKRPDISSQSYRLQELKYGTMSMDTGADCTDLLETVDECANPFCVRHGAPVLFSSRTLLRGQRGRRASVSSIGVRKGGWIGRARHALSGFACIDSKVRARSCPRCRSLRVSPPRSHVRLAAN